ncbi:hypothetical protein ON010_g12642 [Phytophthora cinnamomi]|nr:hypothetical protein ON010_g12642 [Phytophthora cinnamomi]
MDGCAAVRVRWCALVERDKKKCGAPTSPQPPKFILQSDGPRRRRRWSRRRSRLRGTGSLSKSAGSVARHCLVIATGGDSGGQSRNKAMRRRTRQRRRSGRSQRRDRRRRGDSGAKTDEQTVDKDKKQTTGKDKKQATGKVTKKTRSLHAPTEAPAVVSVVAPVLVEVTEVVADMVTSVSGVDVSTPEASTSANSRKRRRSVLQYSGREEGESEADVGGTAVPFPLASVADRDANLMPAGADQCTGLNSDEDPLLQEEPEDEGDLGDDD